VPGRQHNTVRGRRWPAGGGPQRGHVARHQGRLVAIAAAVPPATQPVVVQPHVQQPAGRVMLRRHGRLQHGHGRDDDDHGQRVADHDGRQRVIRPGHLSVDEEEPRGRNA